MRVLHCPTVVGGHPSGLANAERSLGCKSWSVALQQTAFGHAPDQCLSKKDASRLARELARWRLLVKAFFCFDVIHYNFGSSILRWQVTQTELHRSSVMNVCLKTYEKLCSLIEYQLLKNKVIAVTYQGDDARQGDYSKGAFKYSIAQEVDNQYYNQASDNAKRAAIARFDMIADLIYTLNPDLSYVLPSRAKFIPYAHIDLNFWKKIEHPRSKKPIVLHAPTHSGAKGTRFILDAVSQLQKEGVDFEFILVENVKNSEAKNIYEQCDLVIDQLLAGWYGGFSVEAMALGKPVICYIREEDTQFISADMKKDMPFIRANPDTICDVLREWITTRLDELPSRGIASRLFVEKWHDPIKIAQSMIKDYGNY